MPYARPRRYQTPCLAALSALLGATSWLAPTCAQAQSELLTWVNRDLGKQTARAEYRFTLYPDEPVKNQPTDLGIQEYSFNYTVPLYQDAKDEWYTSGDVRYASFDTKAIMPDTGQPLPTELWDILFNLGYRHKFDNEWIGGVTVGVGSPSDEPFASWDEMSVRAFGLLLVPYGERDSWLFSLLYANDQEVFSGFPVPGIAYVHRPSEQFKLVFGVPFSSVEYKPIEELTLEAQYFPLREVRSRVTYAVFRPLRVFAGFDWYNDRYFPVDRPKDDDQLFYYEKRVMGGIRFDLRHAGVQVRGGYAFDRFFFEGEDYGDRDFNRIDVDAGPFIMASVTARF